MSVSASIDIRLIQKYHAIEMKHIIKTLVDYGWNIFRDGEICYSTLDIEDNFNSWLKPINLDALSNILEQKKLISNVISVQMTWENTEVGGELTFYPKIPNISCSFNPDATRKRMPPEDPYGMTDFQWYLPKIVPPLDRKFGLEYFSCSHLR